MELRRRRAGAWDGAGIGHTVYTSSFKAQESIGIDVRTHRKTFSLDSPGHTSMISDGRNLYLIGYFTLRGLAPK